MITIDCKLNNPDKDDPSPAPELPPQDPPAGTPIPGDPPDRSAPGDPTPTEPMRNPPGPIEPGKAKPSILARQHLSMYLELAVLALVAC